MIRFSLGIPVTIRPSFWIVAAVIGFLYSMSFMGTMLWITVIFISVLFHELGHAITAKLFKKEPKIELVAMGGLTYHDSQDLSGWKQFLIVLNGPIFGFVLFGLATLVLFLSGLQEGMFFRFLKIMQLINLFWTVVNLVPVMPLDGGQLLRIIFEGIFGVKGVRYAYLTSIFIAVAIGGFFFVTRLYLVGAIFLLFAFQAFDGYRRIRTISTQDRNQDLQKELGEIEADIEMGKKDEAISSLESVRQKAKEGMIFTVATQYLAFLQAERGEMSSVYKLLLPIRKDLTIETICLLHHAAFEEKDYPLVVELSGRCYQFMQSAEVALRSAHACAFLSQVVPAIGWLKAAMQKGLKNLSEVIEDESFDPIRTDGRFQTFLKKIQA